MSIKATAFRSQISTVVLPLAYIISTLIDASMDEDDDLIFFTSYCNALESWVHWHYLTGAANSRQPVSISVFAD